MNEINFLDLFSGCGGMSHGLEMNSAFKCRLGLDFDPFAIETFKINHTHAVGVLGDIKDVPVRELGKKVSGEIDLIVGGPPCQGFSLTGPRQFTDQRNSLYQYFLNSVKYFKPKAFIVENVPGLAHLWEGAILEEITEKFQQSGYTVSCKILTAADFGVPQIRKRLVLVGTKKSLASPFEFPDPYYKPENYINCEMAISDLPALDGEFLGDEEMPYSAVPAHPYQKMLRKGASKIYNHVAAKHTDDVKQVISLVPEGGNHKDLPRGIGESRKFNEAWTRYHSKRPSKTIDTGHRNHFHYLYNRVPTVRENARLQSFPDKFRFLGNKTSQFRQVGNAVPPLLAKALGKELQGYL